MITQITGTYKTAIKCKIKLSNYGCENTWELIRNSVIYSIFYQESYIFGMIDCFQLAAAKVVFYVSSFLVMVLLILEKLFFKGNFLCLGEFNQKEVSWDAFPLYGSTRLVANGAHLIARI